MAHRAVDAWESLLRAQVTLMKEFSEDFRAAPVTMQEYDVLYTLTRCTDGRSRLRDLADNTRLSQPGLSRLVERMEADDLVTRERDPLDGRGTVVTLTPRGLHVQRAVGRVHARSIVTRVTGALTDDEQAELARLCTKLRVGGHGPR
ncbi:MarR family winged helix-turn-helix transcriptional regulator [uncultured Cellulomonas sp.]|uniref:MarR family winged helix-turn-helix transcriptional regulator n=1 Tax=uncultured Cellulomonas sp. TaxID=189682 RepID=UPI002619EEF0|nr:MarR family transcriptional regulator [uncultured Cellulomonas sp.]